MTICDITASSTPVAGSEIETVCHQIRDAFSDEFQIQPIRAQITGLGINSTITALVRFQQESELQKVLHLESKIKQGTKVDVRDFLGHITLAYYIKSLDAELNTIQEILQPYYGYDFGELSFSKFDLTYFTDMNTFLPLLTVNFANGYTKSHTIDLGNIISEASPS